MTEQQEAFCHAYIEEPIMYKALLKAYPKAKNWTRNTCDVKASQLLDKDKINIRIKMLEDERNKKLSASCTLNKRKLIEAGLEAMEEAKANGSAERTAFTNLLKLLLQQQGYMPAAGGTQVQVHIQNNAIIGDVTKYLDL